MLFQKHDNTYPPTCNKCQVPAIDPDVSGKPTDSVARFQNRLQYFNQQSWQSHQFSSNSISFVLHVGGVRDSIWACVPVWTQVTLASTTPPHQMRLVFGCLFVCDLLAFAPSFTIIKPVTTSAIPEIETGTKKRLEMCFLCDGVWYSLPSTTKQKICNENVASPLPFFFSRSLLQFETGATSVTRENSPVSSSTESGVGGIETSHGSKQPPPPIRWLRSSNAQLTQAGKVRHSHPSPSSTARSPHSTTTTTKTVDRHNRARNRMLNRWQQSALDRKERRAPVACKHSNQFQVFGGWVSLRLERSLFHWCTSNYNTKSYFCVCMSRDISPFLGTTMDEFE